LIVYRFFVPSITLVSDIVAIMFIFFQAKQCVQKVCSHISTMENIW